MGRGEAEAAVLGRPIQPEPALLADLAAERGQLAALELQPVLGHLGLQRSGDVLREELPHFVDPPALLVVELEVHAGDTIGKLSTYKSEPVSVGRAAREWPSPGPSSARSRQPPRCPADARPARCADAARARSGSRHCPAPRPRCLSTSAPPPSRCCPRRNRPSRRATRRGPRCSRRPAVPRRPDQRRSAFCPPE